MELSGLYQLLRDGSLDAVGPAGLGAAAAMALNCAPFALLLLLAARRSRAGFWLCALALAPVLLALQAAWAAHLAEGGSWPRLVVGIVRCRMEGAGAACHLGAGFRHGVGITKRLLLGG